MPASTSIASNCSSPTESTYKTTPRGLWPCSVADPAVERPAALVTLDQAATSRSRPALPKHRSPLLHFRFLAAPATSFRLPLPTPHDKKRKP